MEDTAAKEAMGEIEKEDTPATLLNNSIPTQDNNTLIII